MLANVLSRDVSLEADEGLVQLQVRLLDHTVDLLECISDLLLYACGASDTWLTYCCRVSTTTATSSFVIHQERSAVDVALMRVDHAQEVCIEPGDKEMLL